MRAHVVSVIVVALTAGIVLSVGPPFGTVGPRIGAVFAAQGLANQIREFEKEKQAKNEQERAKNLQLEVDLARIQQQDLALLIRNREFDLEAERRRTARLELEALKSQRETLEKRVEYARKAVLASFDVSDRGFVPNPQKLPTSLRRAQLLKENMLKRLLLFSGDSKNYIANGTALNFLLELCGKSAFAGEFNRAAIKAGQGPNPAEVVECLSQFTRFTLIKPRDLEQIQYQQGLAGPRLSGRFNEQPLDTNWPAILRSDTFRPRTQDIEKRRAQVLGQLKNNNGISAKSADGLLDAVRDLLTAMQDEENAMMRKTREIGGPSREKTDWFRLHRAEEPIRVLLAGCYRLIEARKIEDVMLPPLNGPKGVTIERLLAYMHENKLNFSPSDANGQGAYGRILELMVSYYSDMAQCKIDTEYGEKRVEVLRQQEAEINEVALGNKLNNFQQTEVEVHHAQAAAEQAKADAEQWKAIGEIGTALIQARGGL
jgi:hypothetical protein